ncbi:fimbrial protein [Herbaspirillum autotrophicum]|uniref:fimbrial protein n=1 Tax=Herbaspirillum autotrophicum TaxID=180195 RepID=UPI0009FA4410|nr:fimbrial protein [Herbaspirillum autotrophicum]
MSGNVFLRAGIARTGTVIKTAAAIVLMLLTGMAQAVTCTTTSAVLAMQFPASVTVPRDAVAGTLLTPWTRNAFVVYNCQNADPARWTGLGAWSTMANDRSASVVVEGLTYPTFSTGLQGVSMIARYMTTSGIFYPAPASPQKKLIVSGRGGTAYPTFTMGVSLALVKTGNIAGGTVNAGIFGNTGAGEANTATDRPGQDDYTLRSPASVTYNAVNIGSGTCSVPNVTVNLGSYPHTQFTTTFSSTRPTDFNVRFTNCPESVRKISLSLSRTTGSGFSNTSGVFEPDEDSSAGGVGVKVMEASGTAITFDRFYPLTAYAGSGGNVNFPLKAALIKFGAVTAGSVKGSLRINILYE